MRKHSINIHGHPTSITLEDEFWNALKDEAESSALSLNKLISKIDDNRSPENNLSSAVRVYILKKMQTRIENLESTNA